MHRCFLLVFLCVSLLTEYRCAVSASYLRDPHIRHQVFKTGNFRDFSFSVYKFRHCNLKLAATLSWQVLPSLPPTAYSKIILISEAVKYIPSNGLFKNNIIQQALAALLSDINTVHRTCSRANFTFTFYSGTDQISRSPNSYTMDI